MQKITLSKSQKKILLKHAKREEPNESCAVLFGKENIVTEVFLTKNIEESPVNFTISSEQLIQAYSMADKKKTEVIGIFHSHPASEAYPSSTDEKFMLSNPVVWVIYSGINKNFRAFVLESDIREITVEEK